MPITEILAKNAQLYGDDVALVEINPQELEKRLLTSVPRLSLNLRSMSLPGTISACLAAGMCRDCNAMGA